MLLEYCMWHSPGKERIHFCSSSSLPHMLGLPPSNLPVILHMLMLALEARVHKPLNIVTMHKDHRFWISACEHSG